ncbi:MAG TPA: hypothetical protein VI122_21125 [Thermoleophilaceae bacterium]
MLDRRGAGARSRVVSGASYTADGGTSHVHSFQARQTVFRAVTSNDIALRRPAFFTVMTGVRP